MNLTDITLTEDQERVLNKGLGFVPTNHVDLLKLRCELAGFFRSIRLKAFFGKDSEDREQEGDTGLRSKFTFVPTLAQIPPEIGVFTVNREREQSNRINNNKRYNNLTILEQQAVQELIEDYES